MQLIACILCGIIKFFTPSFLTLFVVVLWKLQYGPLTYGSESHSLSWTEFVVEYFYPFCEFSALRWCIGPFCYFLNALYILPFLDEKQLSYTIYDTSMKVIILILKWHSDLVASTMLINGGAFHWRLLLLHIDYETAILAAKGFLLFWSIVLNLITINSKLRLA